MEDHCPVFGDRPDVFHLADRKAFIPDLCTELDVGDIVELHGIDIPSTIMTAQGDRCPDRCGNHAQDEETEGDIVEVFILHGQVFSSLCERPHPSPVRRFR
jgi:hypothetical protein